MSWDKNPEARELRNIVAAVVSYLFGVKGKIIFPTFMLLLHHAPQPA